ncbi:predicted protein [Arabidopsis lyrata subsp. lyrata]|uniref:Predicted protein n=1 Tax=Arabidopsis lyrata subsp. lyrata TaxID=81972 RepID=D7MW00_ARALL|nr:predicted protein [Arabidopsis lyrata subsp. lyrata]
MSTANPKITYTSSYHVESHSLENQGQHNPASKTTHRNSKTLPDATTTTDASSKRLARILQKANRSKQISKAGTRSEAKLLKNHQSQERERQRIETANTHREHQGEENSAYYEDCQNQNSKRSFCLERIRAQRESKADREDKGCKEMQRLARLKRNPQPNNRDGLETTISTRTAKKQRAGKSKEEVFYYHLL